jgi:hypothetical protein
MASGGSGGGGSGVAVEHVETTENEMADMQRKNNSLHLQLDDAMQVCWVGRLVVYT